MFHSIRWRLVASYVVLTLSTVTLMGLLGLSLVRQQVQQRELDYLTANAHAVAQQAEQVMQSTRSRQGLQQLAQTSAFLANARVRILDPDRNPLADSGPRNEVEQLVWIAPPAGTRLSADSEARYFGPILMALPDAGWRPRSGPTANGASLFLQDRLPAGTQYLLVQRTNDPWGSRVTFQVEMMQEMLNLLNGSGMAVEGIPDPAPQGQPQLPQAAGPADGADQALGAQQRQIVRTAIGDPDRPLGFVEVIGASNLGNESRASTGRAFLLAGLVAALIAVLAGLVVSRSLAAPIGRLSEAAGQMSAGDLSVRAPATGRDEIGQLACQFNRMAERLEASFAELAAERDALRRFIADASHELRTPITALKSFNELLQGPAAGDPAAQAEFLAESQAQIGRLEWITANLLNLSRLEAGLVELDLSRHDAGELLEAAVAPFRPAAADKRVTLTIRPPETSLALICDRARLELALSNLLDNALKFTPSGGWIEVGVRPSGHEVHLWVKDTGTGIHPDDQARIFERFYRGQNSVTAGNGLGLAIVKGIVQAHGGEVAVESGPGQGSVFSIRLPMGG